MPRAASPEVRGRMRCRIPGDPRGMQREMRARHGAMRGQMQQVPTQEMRDHLPRQHDKQRPVRVRREVCDGGGALQGKVSRVAAAALRVALPS
jgi:hypothetical protein